ncbi:MAG TPA: YciI family protein [Rugosimonospora sp.]|nr:YciI family protein [Rugosimonospora sp.]
MAQYLISVLHETGELATPAEMAAIDVFNEQLQADGHWVFAAGLASPSTATVVDGRDGEPVFTDGPYLESKEHIVGFWIIEAPHLDVALRLAGLGSKHCNRRVELRPLLSE